MRRALAELRMNQAEWERSRAEAEQLQEKVEKSQGEIYRLKAKLENAQSEKENLQVSHFCPPPLRQIRREIQFLAVRLRKFVFPVSQEEYERCQGSVSRLHAERDKAVSDVEKVREELERCQSTLGKLQLQQEKTQQGYDKAQNEVDRLQERLDKTLAESRKVNRSALFSFYRFLSDNFCFFLLLLLLFVGMVAAYRFGSLLRLSH